MLSGREQIIDRYLSDHKQQPVRKVKPLSALISPPVKGMPEACFQNSSVSLELIHFNPDRTTLSRVLLLVMDSNRLHRLTLSGHEVLTWWCCLGRLWTLQEVEPHQRK